MSVAALTPVATRPLQGRSAVGVLGGLKPLWSLCEASLETWAVPTARARNPHRLAPVPTVIRALASLDQHCHGNNCDRHLPARRALPAAKRSVHGPSLREAAAGAGRSVRGKVGCPPTPVRRYELRMAPELGCPSIQPLRILPGSFRIIASLLLGNLAVTDRLV